MKHCLLTVISALLLCPVSPDTHAQGFSYDGNRWYEIEVSIFSNENSAGSNELAIPDKVTLSYPESIRQLEPAISSLLVDFEADEPESSPNPLQEPEPQQDQEPAEALVGPPPAPGETRFKLTDFSRDPYIALGDEEAEFADYNAAIDRSSQHRLLFHAVWRQPVLNRVQATAIFVNGGDQYGMHHELEGSLRFSFNVNRVDVETNLWLATFAAVSAFPSTSTRANNSRENSSPWQLPQPPFSTADTPLAPDLPVTRLSYMNQVRPMISNELHYLDHPDLGMLVQIRPYELPQPASFTFE